MTKFNYPPGYSFVQTYQRAIKLVNSPLESIIESADRFGDTYSVYSGLTSRMILTQDPEFIEYVLKKNHRNYHKSEMVSRNLAKFLGKGLLTSNGSHWLKQRRLIQPGFHIQKIQGLHAIMRKTTDDFLDKFSAGENIDIFPHMNRFAFELVINTLFDIDLPLESRNELSRFVSETQEFVIRDIRQPHMRWWHRISGEVRSNLKKSARAREILRGIIDTRRASKEKFHDLLDMLLDARYEDTGEPMREEQILDEILVLIIAGHETTANALTWTLYLLAGDRAVLDSLRQSTGGLDNRQIIASESMNAVISESLRLYPPAWAADRVALEDDRFKDWTFAKGTVIVMFFYGLHRSPKHWKNESAFLPDRFIQAERSNAFYPFGAGPRLCIGNNFAIAEMALFLHAFIHRFDIERTLQRPRVKPLITLRPEGVTLSIKNR